MAYIFWDPSKEIFIIPILRVPLLWYSFLFAVGFFVGYYLFVLLLKRYYFFPFSKEDIKNWKLFIQDFKSPKNEEQKAIANIFFEIAPGLKNVSFQDLAVQDQILSTLNALVEREDLFQMSKEKKRFVFFSKRYYVRLFIEKTFENGFISQKKKISFIVDRLLISSIIATIVGARLGHLLFYEHPSFYLLNPLQIIKTWEGGLASHGAIIAILIAIFLFSRSLKKREIDLSWINLLDLMAIPGAFAAACIRVGNFFNQEIIGNPSRVPWAIIFGHPSGATAIVPRHPVQLYEALFYLCIFLFLLFLAWKTKILEKSGYLIGLFFTLVFSFRFYIEFFKIEESDLIRNISFFTMGQYLSFPLIVVGLLFLCRSFWKDKKKILDH